MKRIALLLLAALPFQPAFAAEYRSKLPPKESYLGSQGCAGCHQDKHAGWKRTFHSTVVQDAKTAPDVVLGDFARDGIGFGKDDVEFTIGGHWNQRYMKRIGDDYFVLPKLWSVPSQKWEPSDQWSWKKKPYHVYCVGCHSTRYDPESRDFVEHTVGCEACHGPGRSHADSGGAGPIINPRKLGQDGIDLLCASCHVRGTDPTGTYQFPAGFVPGRNLEVYYVPNGSQEGEDPRQALLRLFRGWRDRVRSGSKECEVCGLYGDREKREPKTVTEYCMNCHKFGDGYAAHTRHVPAVSIGCTDCHRKVGVDRAPGEDVHSLGYFLVHNQTCYDRDFTKACGACHSDFSADRLASLLQTWRRGSPKALHD